MIQNILYHLRNTFVRCQCFFRINSRNLLILLSILLLYCIDVINAERQNITIVDCIHNGVGMQLIAKRLLCGLQIGIATGTGIHGEDRCSGKAEDMVILKISIYPGNLFTLLDLTADNSRVHITELTPMAFVEHQNNMLISDRM